MSKKHISISIAIISFVVGITIIPKFSKKLENKIYKKSMNISAIDFENIGPEIVKK